MNYNLLLASLEALEVDQSPPEVHGLLCGLLCTSRVEKAKSLWFSTVLQDYSANPEKLRENGEILKELEQFFHRSVEQLNDADMAFGLIVEEEITLPHMHLLQLSSWCNGFGLGFGMGERAQSGQPLPADTEELLADFQAIAAYESSENVQDSPVSAADEDNEEESDVVEIEEFIRVGVLLINEEMRPLEAQPVKTQSNAAPAEPGADNRTLH